MITGKNYIGNTASAEGNTTYNTINPKLNENNSWSFTEATKSEIDKAAQLASKAFNFYKNVTGKERAMFLNAIAEEIEALGDALIDVYMKESGLPEGRALGERGRTIGQLKSFANLVETDKWRNSTLDEAIPDRSPAPKPEIRKILIPIGPIVVFGASNFPLAFSTAGGDTASALAAGCPVIVKSHPMHAGTSELVAIAILKAAERTGMPNGVFSHLNSNGISVGEQLVSHPKIKGVGFTGSIKGGRALYNLAANREEPIPVFAEMGSVNPVIITPNAIKERGKDIATTYANSITLGTGQFCTNPGLLLTVKDEQLEGFITDLAEKTVATSPQCMLHPNIKRAYEATKKEVVSQNGINLIASHSSDHLEANQAPAAIAKISGRDFLKNPKTHQEVFGPFSLVVVCENQSELVEVITQLEGQLTGTIIAETSDYETLHSVIDALQERVGRIIFNGVPTGVEVCESMTHGGPYPASTDSRFTAVGIHAIKRWVRPFSYQDFPSSLLPNIFK